MAVFFDVLVIISIVLVDVYLVGLMAVLLDILENVLLVVRIMYC